MTELKEIIEEWATKYKPMLHTPGETGKNKRFFLFDNIVAIPSFMSKLPDVKSPCVGYEFAQDGTIRGGMDKPVHVIYFLVKTGNMNPTDKQQSYEAIQEAKMHMQKFLAWLREQQEKRNIFRNINLETEELHYSTYGPFLNNWYAVFVELTDVQKVELCVDTKDYVE